MPNVLVTPREVAPFAPRFQDALEAAGLTLVFPLPGEANLLTPTELRAALVGVEATIAGSEAYPAELFAEHPQLRVVARVGVGFDAVDTVAATAAGVAVCTAPGTNQESVAEHVFALMLGFTRHVVTRTNGIRAGAWPRHFSLPLRGQTLGLAGLGRIGKAVATRAVAFGMNVIAFDPAADATFAGANGVRLVSFAELLAASDFLSLHLPLTPTTRHVMDAVAFAAMKPTAVLVNTSRGGLVNEAALVAALKAGKLAGALLDVLEEEPPPADHPLFACENVILTPHAAGVDVRSLGDMARSAAEAIASLWKGEWPAEKVVNPAVRPAFRWGR
ncbi:phosphoglycerate dehydrogenase [Limnoglobus roseus]|uniref:D-3-phosphoglycerate dehydrogenase n=1 Tax=Limnoglobus roseus TaxID=2598579 RepID=A0A5C1APL2_9BACT|nr:phosphoglycerate dehydrogenase [Limnoglobus roseus]QEL20940.1 D-3-phosphoglycerate dehydrogenase [Limnoglobus roseus]